MADDHELYQADVAELLEPAPEFVTVEYHEDALRHAIEKSRVQGFFLGMVAMFCVAALIAIGLSH